MGARSTVVCDLSTSREPLDGDACMRCKKLRRGRKKQRGPRKDDFARGADVDEVRQADDSAAVDNQIEHVLWVGDKGRRIVSAAAAQNAAAATGCSVDHVSHDYLAASSAATDGGRPPARLTFAERRALDMEMQELERGLLLWPDADMVEERTRSLQDRSYSSGTVDWRSKRAEAIRRKALRAAD